MAEGPPPPGHKIFPISVDLLHVEFSWLLLHLSYESCPIQHNLQILISTA